MNHNNKRFIVLMLFVSLFITNIFGVCQQEFWASAKTDTKKYYVKEKYMRDLGKKFKVFKKKYGWTSTNREYEFRAQCVYQIPEKKIWYTFQGDNSGESWKMKDNSKCIRISMKAKSLVKGFKGKTKINKFVSQLDSKKKKASWHMGGQLGTTAMIAFYAKNGQKYWLNIEMDNEKDRWISANEMIRLVKA